MLIYLLDCPPAVLQKKLWRATLKRFRCPPPKIIYMALFAAFYPSAAMAQLVNGDFENSAPGPGSAITNGNPNGDCIGGTGFYRYAPTPWSKQSTPDYHTERFIFFDTAVATRTSLPGFDTSPNGGCFMGFRSLSATANEGIFQTITIADASAPLKWTYEYTEYTRPSLPRCTPEVEFRVNSNDDSNGVSISRAPTVGAVGGPSSEGNWVELETSAFTPEDFGVTDGGTLDVYVGVIANGCSATWAYVDGLTIVRAIAPSLSMKKEADGLDPYTVGDTITYTYTVTNDGTETIRNVSINDTHNGSDPAPSPRNETLLTDTPPLGDSTDSGLDGNWEVLAPGDVLTFTGTYVVTQTDVDNL